MHNGHVCVHRTFVAAQRICRFSVSLRCLTRKGFTLVPDFASTAFMVQGMNLSAELAECGDIFDTPGISEMLATYVILSRVRKADGLLLLRAFSPYLFRLGSAPGPYCLLKLLHPFC